MGRQDVVVMTKMWLAMAVGDEHLLLAAIPARQAKAITAVYAPQLSPRASSGARWTPASPAKGTLPEA